MELYEIKEKVGSDPCLVLDFDAEVTIDTDTNKLLYKSILKTFNSKAEAEAYISNFAILMEELTETRCVQLRFKSHTDNPRIAQFNNTLLVTSNIFFGASVNPDANFTRAMLITLPLTITRTSVNFLMIYSGLEYVDGNWSAELQGVLSLT